MASVVALAAQPKCLQKCNSVYTSTYMYSLLVFYTNTYIFIYHSRPIFSFIILGGGRSATTTSHPVTASTRRMDAHLPENAEQLHYKEQTASSTATSALSSPDSLQGCQLEVYTTVKERNNPSPLRMVVTGTAGTGKSQRRMDTINRCC